MRTTSFLRRSVSTLAATVLLVTGRIGAGIAHADDEGDGRLVTYAEAVVTGDGGFEFDSAFRIADFEEEVLDAGNYAFANAKGCEGCQAVALTDHTPELSADELEAETAETLPDREAMSLVNANVAAPINLAAALNVASDNSIAYANAEQTAPITQGI